MKASKHRYKDVHQDTAGCNDCGKDSLSLGSECGCVKSRCKKCKKRKPCLKCNKYCGPSKEEVQRLIDEINTFIADQAEICYRQIKGFIVPFDENLISEMILFSDLLERYLLSDECMCSDDYQKIKSKVYKHIKLNHIVSDQKKDSSGKQEWIIKNPYCVGLERWERALYDFPFQHGLVVRNIPRERFGEIHGSLSVKKKELSLKEVENSFKNK